MDNKKLQMRGIVGLYAANAVGDDIEVYTDDSRTEVQCRWAPRLLARDEQCMQGCPLHQLLYSCTMPCRVLFIMHRALLLHHKQTPACLHFASSLC